MHLDTPPDLPVDTGPTPAPRRRRGAGRGGVTRKLGAVSAPAGLLALCAAMAAAFVWGASGGMAQIVAGALSLSLAHEAALFAFPVLAPLVLIAVHQLHWRLMRRWLKRAARAVLALWALAALLMAYALL